MIRRAKIVATIGPASQDEHMLKKLILAGTNVVRLNFSHGTHKNYTKIIQRIRKVSADTNSPVAILQDLQGPKIRTADLGADGIDLIEGETITLTTKKKPSQEEIPIDYPELHKYVSPKERVLLDDGSLELLITEVNGQNIITEVIIGGKLLSNKGVNLPGSKLAISSFTEKDKEDLLFGLENDVDAVAISFVQNAQDITIVREAIVKNSKESPDIPIIAKLERPQALDNLDEILDIADGVMVARGDLGVELPPEVVPIAQKRIIKAANQYGKLVITATQMLDSMIHNPRPTRAETTDVANAIFDGTDAVMLSGETAVGKYPEETVKMMNAIIHESEENLKGWGHWHGTPTQSISDDAISTTKAARELAHDLNVAAIVVFTQTGRTARLMSKTLPRVPILGFTSNERTCRRMSLYWGVFPFMVEYSNTIEEMLAKIEAEMTSTTFVKPGQQVVVVCGFPLSAGRPPNLALLHTVGEQ